jgi:GT2 family glycosyltransferase
MTRAMIGMSVVICAYTEARWNDLVAAVASVQRQTVPPLEIIVVIDHNPRLLDRARAHIPGVVAVENHEQRGLGGARNSGVAVAKGEVIAFLDDDAVAVPEWLEQFSTAYNDEHMVGVGGAIEPTWKGHRPGWFPEEFNWVVGCTYRGMPEVTAAVRNLIGCNMSFRREAFEAVGKFRLGYGCDETEFCIRLQQHWPQKILLYKPQAKVYHHVDPNRARWRYFCSRCYFEGGSKAVVSWLLGPRDGLASERSYTLRILPRGVIHGLADTILHRDKAGLARAGAIIAGLAITTLGYLMGRISIVEAAHKRGWNNQLTPRST